MVNRVAFFAGKEEVEDYYGLKTKKEVIFEPSYNIAPGNQLPVILKNSETNELEIKRVRWGETSESGRKDLSVYKDDLKSFLKTKKTSRCAVPMSGFYIWKKDDPNKQPFFVRMLNDSVMSVAAFYDYENDTVTLVTSDSNTLIQPMTEQMPLLLDRSLSEGWVGDNLSTEELITRSKDLYMLTDLSVLKVSKKVNDLKNNDPKLIQPIPK